MKSNHRKIVTLFQMLPYECEIWRIKRRINGIKEQTFEMK